MSSALSYCGILMKLEFSRYNFEKFSNINFHKNPSGGSRIVSYGRTEGQIDEANFVFSHFGEGV
jgi:hypothetical protein